MPMWWNVPVDLSKLQEGVDWYVADGLLHVEGEDGEHQTFRPVAVESGYKTPDQVFVEHVIPAEDLAIHREGPVWGPMDQVKAEGLSKRG
jgi:hypothetical protein